MASPPLCEALSRCWLVVLGWGRAWGAHADLCDLTAVEVVGQLASFGLPVMAKDPGAKLDAA